MSDKTAIPEDLKSSYHAAIKAGDSFVYWNAAFVRKLIERIANLEEHLSRTGESLNAESAKVFTLIEENNTLKARITELEAQLAALQWRPITAFDLPIVGEEVWNAKGWVTDAHPTTEASVESWLSEGFTHHRALNAPQQ